MPNDGDINLFQEYCTPSDGEENPCCNQKVPEKKPAEKPAKRAKGATSPSSSTPAKTPEERAIDKLKETMLPGRTIRVKMYNETFDFEAPEEVAEPTLEDVRQFMFMQGFYELEPQRASLSLITPEGQEAFVLCLPKAEKMG